MSREGREVVILGGGITGLTAAYYLKKYCANAGLPVSITLVEKSDRLGGKVHTIEREGFVIEKGADSFLARKLPIIDLTRELGLEDRFVGTGRKGKRSYFLQHGRFHEMPKGMVLGIPTDLSAFMETAMVSPDGKARALEDLAMPRSEEDGDESLGGFLERRLGPEMVENIAEPLLAGIYAGDLYQLSLNATFPQFKEAEQRYGSVIQGMQESQKQSRENPGGTRAGAGSAFLSYQGGLRTIIDALVGSLEDVAILTGKEAVKIEANPHHAAEAVEAAVPAAAGVKTPAATGGEITGAAAGASNAGGGDAETGRTPGYRVKLADGTELTADSVIVTLPTYEYPGLLPELPGLTELSAMLYVSVANVVMAFDEKDVSSGFDGSGFVISRKEGRFITACTWTSSKWEHTAPPGKMLLRCYVGRAGDQEWIKLTDAEIADKVRQEIRELMEITAEPLFHEVTRLYRSMPNYPVGHLETVKQARSELRHAMPGVYVTGAAFHGVGLPDCVRQGEETAEESMLYLLRK